MKRITISILGFGLASVVTMFAVWSCNDGNFETEKMRGVEFEIIFDADGGTPVPPVQRLTGASKVQEPDPAPVRPGSILVGWRSDYGPGGGLFDFGTTIFPYRQAYTLKAVWEDTYNVTLNAGDGYFLLDDGQRAKEYEISVRRDVPMNFPEIVPLIDEEGKEFFKWYTELPASSENLFDFDNPITGDTVIYARYVTPGTLFSVTFDSRGGSRINTLLDVDICPKPDAPTKTVTYPVSGNDPIVRTPAFRFWIDESGKKFDFSEPLKRDITLYAVWEPLPDAAFDIDVTNKQIKAIKSPYAEVEEHYDLPEKVTVGGTEYTIVGLFDARLSSGPNNPANYTGDALALAVQGTFTRNKVAVTVYMPETYSRLGLWTFAGATKLEKVFYYGVTEAVPQSVNNWTTFGAEPTFTHQPFARSSMTEAHIPATVTKITARHLYFACVNLTKMHFHGAGDIEFGQSFPIATGCTALKVVIIEKTTPPVIPAAFVDATSLEEIWVPKGCLEAYQTADVWSGWANKMKELNY